MIARHPLPWILLLAAALRWSTCGYLRSSDDLVYATAAAELLEGRYDPASGSFHRLRFGVILPTAAAFAVFGVRPGASVAWPLVASLASIAVLFRLVARRSSTETAAWAALYLAVCTQHVLSGAELFPDAPLLLWTLLALDLYLEERERPGKPWRYVAAGACFYAALATRIEAVKLLPLFAGLEIWAWRRRGPDRRALGAVAALAGLMAVDTAILGGARLRELFPAVEGWAASPAARELGAGVMLKSMVSPFGAFGVLVPLGVAGAVVLVREKRDLLPLVAGGYLIVVTIAVAAAYRIADGRHWTLVAPFVAWPAAELLGARPRLRPFAGVGIALACGLLFHARAMPDTAAAYARLEAAAKAGHGPVTADRRTAGALRLYFRGVEAHDFADAAPRFPGWLADNPHQRGIDRALYGRDPYPGDLGRVVESIPLRLGGLPGVRRFAALLFPGRLPKDGVVSVIRLRRLEE